MPGVITSLVKVYSDGACSGNPGPGAVGVVILDENNQELATCKECIGEVKRLRQEIKDKK